MWLVHVNTLELKHFSGPYEAHVQDAARLRPGAFTPHYAILSHTWGDDEVTFQQLQAIRSWPRDPEPRLRKICNTCEQARKDGFKYVWIDTCCIDKTSSAELSEAINSMFEWYAESSVCYAILEDVCLEEPKQRLNIAESRWFTRGWTLQELIAPKRCQFFDQYWRDIGERHTWAREIGANTGIPEDLLETYRPAKHRTISLLRSQLANLSAAVKMSWASTRETTRVEDQAYCLLGLFDVNMPLLYGEGFKAFVRLQEAILRDEADLSIITAEGIVEDDSILFARSPSEFVGSGSIVRRSLDNTPHHLFQPELVSNGVRITVPLMIVKVNKFPWKKARNQLVAVLNLGWEGVVQDLVGLKLYSSELTTPASETDIPHELPTFHVSAFELPPVTRFSNARTISVDFLEVTKRSVNRTITIKRKQSTELPSKVVERSYKSERIWVISVDQRKGGTWKILESWPPELWKENRGLCSVPDRLTQLRGKDYMAVAISQGLSFWTLARHSRQPLNPFQVSNSKTSECLAICGFRAVDPSGKETEVIFSRSFHTYTASNTVFLTRFNRVIDCRVQSLDSTSKSRKTHASGEARNQSKASEQRTDEASGAWVDTLEDACKRWRDPAKWEQTAKDNGGDSMAGIKYEVARFDNRTFFVVELEPPSRN